MLRLHFESKHQGAVNWAREFNKALDSLKHNPARGLAPESVDHDEPIREKLFKTRQGLSYRILFVVRGQRVFVLHIRGPGQDLILPDEMRLPPVQDE